MKILDYILIGVAHLIGWFLKLYPLILILLILYILWKE